MCRLDAGSAGVLTERDIPDALAAILTAPVVSDRLTECLGTEGDLAGVEGNLLGGMPESGFGILVPGQAADAGGLDDQTGPLGVALALEVEGLDQTGFMTAVALGIDTFETVGRRFNGGDVLERGQQARLVGLDLGE